jgi:hypothetical protein
LAACIATRGLVVSVRRVSGREVVADSSKSPMRAYLLTKVDGIEMVLLHLVRDPRGVVWSRLKALGRQREAARANLSIGWLVVRSTLDWILVNLLTAALFRSTGRGRRVRYEDMVRNPKATLEAIESLVGLDPSSSGQAIAAGQAVGYGHMVGGNPRRLAGAAPIVFDQEWSTASPAWVRRLVWWIAGPLARHYGYRR